MSNNSESATGSHIISRILTPALRLWLNTQIEGAQDLALSITSSDRQILRGHIPAVYVSANQVVYRGLHLSSIDVAAHNICTNGLQVLRGCSFKLLKPVPIEVALMLTEDDLNQSLQTHLLQDAVEDLVQHILMEFADQPQSESWQITAAYGDTPLASRVLDGGHVSQTHITLQSNTITITGQVTDGDRPSSFRLKTGLMLANGHTLVFHAPCLEIDGLCLDGRSRERLENFSIDFGDTTDLSSLAIGDRYLTCQGRLLVVP